MPVAGLCSVPFGGLLKSSRDFGIGFFVPAPLARAICWPWARKIRQWADFGRPQPSSAQLLLFSAPIRPKIPTILRVPLKEARHVGEGVIVLELPLEGLVCSGRGIGVRTRVRARSMVST